MTRDELLAAIRDADPEALAEWVGACAEGQATALYRLAQSASPVDAGPRRTERASRNLSASEAAKRAGVSRDTLYKRAREGKLPFASRIGRRVLFDEGGLERWRRQRRTSEGR